MAGKFILRVIMDVYSINRLSQNTSSNYTIHAWIYEINNIKNERSGRIHTQYSAGFKFLIWN